MLVTLCCQCWTPGHKIPSRRALVDLPSSLEDEAFRSLQPSKRREDEKKKEEAKRYSGRATSTSKAGILASFPCLEWYPGQTVGTSTKHESTWKVLERCRVKSTVQACCPVLYCCTLTYCAQLSPAHSPGHHNSSLALNSLRRSLTPLQRRRRSSYRTLLRCVSPHPPPSA